MSYFNKPSKKRKHETNVNFVRRVENAIVQSPELYEKYKEQVAKFPNANRDNLVRSFVNWNVKRSFNDPLSIRIHAAVLGITEDEMKKIFIHDGNE